MDRRLGNGDNYAFGRRLLDREERFSALFAFNDLSADFVTVKTRLVVRDSTGPASITSSTPSAG
jgi:hypothetical protein